MLMERTKMQHSQGHLAGFHFGNVSGAFLGESVGTEAKTLINFPSEQSIKNPTSYSGFHSGRKGHNYIVKNSSYLAGSDLL